MTMASAPTAYDEIAATRPRIRRDVLYTRTPNGVHFHNARGGFSVVMPSAYRFASLIVPHLTGATTVEALCQGLGDKQRDMVAQLVGTLYARGFARDAVPPAPDAPVPEPAVAERFAAQIGYVDHYVDEAATRFLRFRTTRVAVLGEGRLACWAALSLIRNGVASVAVQDGLDAPGNRFAELTAEAADLREQGCPAEITVLPPPTRPGPLGWDDLADWDLVIVTGEDAARQTAALGAAVPAAKRVLPAWTFGRSAVVGPLLAPGTAGCFTCAVLRLGDNGDPAAAAGLWSALAPNGPRDPAVPVAGPLAAMLGNLLAYEVFRLATGALRAETAGQLLIQDTESLDTVAEPLLPHPRCPSCAALPAPSGPAPAADVAELGGEEGELPPPERPSVPETGNAEADEAALAELTDRSALVQPAAGVFRAYADEEWAQTPLKVGTVVLGTGHGRRREVSAFDVHHVAGARLRALLRAAEVYAEHVVPPGEVLAGAAFEAAREKWPVVGPQRLAIASGLGLGPQDVAAWCPAGSLLGGGTALVPAAALRPFGPYNRDRAVEASAAGTGAGRTPREAAARGLLTALGHEALRGALHRTTPIRAVDPEAVAALGDAELTFLVRSAANLGAALEILDLGTPGERTVPVVLARAGERWALGAAPAWRDAALEAVRDLLGAVQLAAEPKAPQPLDTGDPLLRDLAPQTIAATGPATAPDPGEHTDWAGVAARLRAAGRDVLAAPVPAPDLAAGRVFATRVLLTTGPADAH
jgi:bacteriocin biosynthesis cyclodehydratase domain-containing protein